MGLFDKKYCDICGDKIGLLGNRKLEDGNCCKNCARKLSPWFNERRHSTVAEIRQQLAYREENQSKAAQFQITRELGRDWRVLFDDAHGWFTLTRARDLTGDNPDILAYSQLTGSRLDVEETRRELKRQDKDGKQVSYDPPRYAYSYNFDLTVTVNSPYFDAMTFRVNPRPVTLESEAPRGFSLTRPIDPTYNIESGGIDAARVHGEVFNHVLRQLVGLPGGGVAPVGELRGDDDQLGIGLRPRLHTVPTEVRTCGIRAKPHPVVPRHGHDERVGFCAVIAAWQIIAVMDRAVRAVQRDVFRPAGLHGGRFRCALLCIGAWHVRHRRLHGGRFRGCGNRGSFFRSFRLVRRGFLRAFSCDHRHPRCPQLRQCHAAIRHHAPG